MKGRTASYQYDNLYRLTQETIAGAANPAANGVIGYQYDKVGNRLQRTSTVTAVPAASYSYDADDRLTTDTYDANGNTAASGANTYTYDFENHLTGQNAGAVSIVYDGDGNRVAKTAGGVTTQYLVDDRNLTGYAQVLEEISGGAVQRVYTCGLYRISQGQTSGTSFYGYDGHGNVRLLTDTSGTVTDRYDYDAFGNIISQSGTTPNVYMYSGEQSDPNVGFYYLRARYLVTGTGRFLNEDSPDEGSEFDPPTLHRYLYATGNPTNRIDPSGQFSLPELSISVAISATLNAIANYHAGQAYSTIATNLFIGGLEGAAFYGAGELAIQTFIQLGRAINVAKAGGTIAKIFSKISQAGPLIPGTSLPSRFVFQTSAGDVLVSSGAQAPAGALKHIVLDILRKASAGSGSATTLAEGLALEELKAAIEQALLSGVRSGQAIIVRTAYAEWELIFDLSGPIPKLFHALPRIL